MVWCCLIDCSQPSIFFCLHLIVEGAPKIAKAVQDSAKRETWRVRERPELAHGPGHGPPCGIPYGPPQILYFYQLQRKKLITRTQGTSIWKSGEGPVDGLGTRMARSPGPPKPSRNFPGYQKLPKRETQTNRANCFTHELYFVFLKAHKIRITY